MLRHRRSSTVGFINSKFASKQKEKCLSLEVNENWSTGSWLQIWLTLSLAHANGRIEFLKVDGMLRGGFCFNSACKIDTGLPASKQCRVFKFEFDAFYGDFDAFYCNFLSSMI
eukprot:GHVP01061239.1.p1 GENE.GHVP01061239.1~~GHVP01061239.1.p1  ORF type:complete len:113 (+),score=13.64 GHVP01061239.1:208-546(+)